MTLTLVQLVHWGNYRMALFCKPQGIQYRQINQGWEIFTESCIESQDFFFFLQIDDKASPIEGFYT